MAVPFKLGIVAGGGALPRRLLEYCEEQGTRPFLIGFEGQTDPALLEGHDHILSRLGAAGEIVKTLKERGIADLVLVGSIRRPHLKELRPDLYTASFFARIGIGLLGDDSLLKAIRTLLEKEGFRLHGIQEIMEKLLMPEGLLGKVKPNRAQYSDMVEGFRISRVIGDLDIGQSAIIQDGVVLGVEGVEGTDELIRRCAEYRRTKTGGILVKTCKPNQDRKLDMPTIGPDTVRVCAALGYEGIAVEAGAALVVDMQDLVREADEAGLFVIGIKAA